MNIFKIPKVYINAEFQRLIWLNFSIPLLCVIIFCYGFFSYHSVVYDDGYHFENLQRVAVVGFWISMLTMGIILQRSFKQDIQSQFWDQLRMSTLTAWQLSWTRLFITPILAWISILICMLLLYLGTVLYVPTQYNYSILQSVFENYVFYTVLMMLMLAIIMASLFIINELQFKRSQGEWNGTYFQLGLLAVVGGIFLNDTIELFEYNSNFSIVAVFDYHFVNHIWHLLSYAILFTVIALFSLYKSMSYKIHLKSSHIYWLVLTLALPFILILIDSIFIPSQISHISYHYDSDIKTESYYSKISILLYYFSSYIVLIYSMACGISVICQNNKAQNFALVRQYLKLKQWRMMFDILPIWVIILPIALMMMGLLSIIIPIIDADFYTTIIHHNIYHVNKNFSFSYFAMQLLFYISIIFILSRLSHQIAPRFNQVNLSLIGFIILYAMWHIVLAV